MRIVPLVLFSLCLFGCNAFTVAPSFPVAMQVGKLDVSGGKVVTDQAKISALLAQLGKIKGGWGYTSHTYPTPQAQIHFVGSAGQALCRLHIGPNWVGSDCGIQLNSKWPPFATVSREQALFFRDFVGGSWVVK